MMEIFVIATLVVFLVGTPGHFVLSPQNLFEMGHTTTPPPQCVQRERTADEPKGKAANYSQTGEYVCRKDIFGYDERPSIYTFMTKHLPGQARTAALRLRTMHREGRVPRDAVWAVAIDFDDPYLVHYAHKLFVTELKSMVPELNVSHIPAPAHAPFSIEVRLHRVDEPFALADVSAVHRIADGPRRWRIL